MLYLKFKTFLGITKIIRRTKTDPSLLIINHNFLQTNDFWSYIRITETLQIVEL